MILLYLPYVMLIFPGEGETFLLLVTELIEFYPFYLIMELFLDP